MLTLTTAGVVVALATLWYTRKEYKLSTKERARPPYFTSLRAYIDKNNTVWFRGKDVASSLGYVKPRNAILVHVGTEYKTPSRDLLSALESPPPNNLLATEIRLPSSRSEIACRSWTSRNTLTQYGY